MPEDTIVDLGVHTCGHAVEAHSDANGCELCDCMESLGRDFSGGGGGEAAVIEAPTAEGGAHG
jgi:hypothetical protein